MHLKDGLSLYLSFVIRLFLDIFRIAHVDVQR